MAVQYNVIKNDRQRAVLHFYASAAGDSATVTLLSLRRTDEIATSTTSELTVNICGAYSNIPSISDSSILVRRGTSSGTVVLELHGCNEYPGNQQLPTLDLNNTSSIFVLFESSGMLMLDLKKVNGYAGPNTNVGV
jgi:hypothetical protein